MSGIDPLRMAQFMVLPGAAELVEAFASIPPGPLRDSIVHHAQTLAAQYEPGPAPGWANVRPAQIGSSSIAPRLPSPFTEGLTAKSPEGQIVERALRGEADHAIAADLGIKLGAVVAIKRKARAEGGLVFPGDDAPKPKGRPPKRASGIVAMPLPAPPWWWEDAAHPNWTSPAALPLAVDASVRSRAFIGPMDRRAYATMTRAAERMGTDLWGYVSHRLDIMRRIDRGGTPMEIATALNIQGTTVYGLLRAVGEQRMEAVNSGAQRPHTYKGTRPYSPEPASPPAASPAPAEAPPAARLPDWPPEPSTKGAQAAKAAAAVKWGFASVEDYDRARVRVRDLLAVKWSWQRIAEELGQPTAFVHNAADFWRRLSRQPSSKAA